jgi:hypothetical protein
MNKMKKISIILLIATLMATQITAVSAADSAILQVSVDDIYLVAGQENTISINLQNTGDYKLYDVEAFLTSAIDGIDVLSDAHYVLSEIDDGKTKTYEPTVYIAEGVDLGVYSLSLNIDYRRFGYEQDTNVEVPISLIVDESYVPKIKFTPFQESLKVKSGSENNVEFGFTNNWNQDVIDVEFTISSPISSITIIDNINTMVETMAPGESVTLTPILSITEGITLGTYTITATASYQDVDGNRYHQTFALPLNLDSASASRSTIITIESMEILQESIRPGDIFTVRLTVKCSGAESYALLSNVAFGTMSSISPISPTTVSLGDLVVDDTVTVSYQLLASGDVSAGQYPVTSTITYTNSKGVKGTLTETFTILVDGLIEFSLLDVPTEKVPVGETSELEADLLLIGTESVQFVAIGVVEDGVIERVSGSDEYIGAVDPDSPIPFDIKYKVRDDAPEGSHELTLSVQYRDHLNKEHIDEMTLDVEIGGVVDDLPEPEQGGIWAWIRRLLGLGP